MGPKNRFNWGAPVLDCFPLSIKYDSDFLSRLFYIFLYLSYHLFQKLLTESSHALYQALDHRVYFKSATIVIPPTWRDSMCQTVIHQPKGNTAYRRPQFHVQDNHPIYGARPYTQQSRGCGQPGDYTGLPFNFLTTWNNTWETFGDPAKLFVKEWAKLRYGIFDELGFAGKKTKYIANKMIL